MVPNNNARRVIAVAAFAIATALGAQVFIVALTGWGQEQDKDEALRAGFDAHLTKPADPAALEQLLEAAEPRVASHDHSSALGSS